MINQFELPNRRYLGSKARLIPLINKVVQDHCPKTKSFADIFAGTGVVASSFFSTHEIIINDLLNSNYHCYKCWFGNEKVSLKKISEIIINENKKINIPENYFSINFSNNFYSLENALRIGSFRENIDNLSKNKIINKREESILLTSLLYATDKVANTCGHYDAFRKNLDMQNRIQFKLPNYNKDKKLKAKIYKENANDLVKYIYSDIIYIDPPYNSRQYSDAYHLLENLINWQKPELFGVAKKYLNRANIKSLFCTKKAPIVFEELVTNLECKYIIVSFNNMENRGNSRSHSKIDKKTIMKILEKKGETKIISQKFNQFTTGKTLIEDHQELLYVCRVR